MIRSNTAVIAVLVFIGFQVVTVSTYSCFECASPILRNNWQLTSYPVIYSDDKFQSACDSDDAPGTPVDCSSSSCIEMMMPTADGGYAMLRGCLEKLLGPDFRSNANNQNSANSFGNCSYGPVLDRKVNFLVGGKIVTADGYAGIHVCQTNDKEENGGKYCNNKMSLAKLTLKYTNPNANNMEKDPVKSFFNDVSDASNSDCQATPNTKVTCISCTSINDNGACDKNTKDTCTGTYCTKAFGKQGKMDVVKRGCSPINPYGSNTDACTWIDFQSKTPMGDGTVGGASRTKRDADLSYTYAANQCFCTGDRCNGASSITFAFFTILTPIFVAVKVL
uniref:Uncharacterized protein n=1 Tax=Plectus sambesii TaxID=2011161 RepID=A0A914VT45_9BILA